MRGAKRSAKNTAKNISLLVLCGLMGVLCEVNWLMGLNIAQTAHFAVCTTAL